jgi:hypothetical protein
MQGADSAQSRFKAGHLAADDVSRSCVPNAQHRNLLSGHRGFVWPQLV